ncbi:protein of unknown function [Beijerinckiaceae bacterium RH AL1]|nr:hypothetical protein [Beijerinckiaceae bacterium]VVB46130.1 protein of unknown function [Beijerinckiaceae bacterium RH CH11]VVB46214.1 protein of unknown function [Beijerinckiaceae bacterium RH AL8]VVC55218.1 protein of unknown function [Beijerinckiaceae bacterium RH AL1]
MLTAPEASVDCVLALADDIEENLRPTRAVVHDLVEWANQGSFR